MNVLYSLAAHCDFLGFQKYKKNFWNPWHSVPRVNLMINISNTDKLYITRKNPLRGFCLAPPGGRTSNFDQLPFLSPLS